MDWAPSAYRRVWEEFRQSATTHDGRHDTPHWRAHHGPYAACVVRIPAVALQPHLGALRRDLARLDEIRQHPDHFLHLMIQELGFVVDPPLQQDEIGAARLEEFAHAAVDPVSRTRRFHVTLGGANSFQDAVFLEVHNTASLDQLHGRLFDLAAIPLIPAFSYLPHCTIAHYTGPMPARDAAAAISPWRESVFGDLMITEVEIVTLKSSSAYPELESYAVIPLAT